MYIDMKLTCLTGSNPNQSVIVDLENLKEKIQEQNLLY